MRWVRYLHEVGMDDVGLVGGKNASLGEMIRELRDLGVRVPLGFAVTAEAYSEFVTHNQLDTRIREIISRADVDCVDSLSECSQLAQDLIRGGTFPEKMATEIRAAYKQLSDDSGIPDTYVAVRSSATAEDLPTASFAGQQDTYLMIKGDAAVLDSVRRAFASLFTARAISYRAHRNFDHFAVKLSVGVQHMVRSDKGASGVMFTLDTESGFRNVTLVTGILGLGEHIVQGLVSPDEFYVHKPTLRQGFRPILRKKLGNKTSKLMFDESTGKLMDVPNSDVEQREFCIHESEILRLANWAQMIEDHYSRKRGCDSPMDIEWARDGETGELFVVQARPETVHSQKKAMVRVYDIREAGPVVASGIPVGESVAAGVARVITDPSKMNELREGEILITEITSPDWEPVMKRAAALVTEMGGRTSHAAIVARELGIPAVVAAIDATSKVPDGEVVTVSTVEGDVGMVHEGRADFEYHELDPTTVDRPQTSIMLNVGSPENAFRNAMLPNDGVGLARMEFIFTSWVKVHPLALTRFDELPADVKVEVERLTVGYKEKREYFVDTLAQGIGMIAGAFYPKPVILRFSDFKTNEYAHLLGGELFEHTEENPMLGWRGASRYYHPDYRDGFLLEVEAVRRVREIFGLRNLRVMVPFCRTPEEGEKVLDVMKEGGLERGKDDLEVFVMAELPSNVWMADEFAQIFDGFSIGSNDLTQLTLGIDRDSARVVHLFDERTPAVRRACATVIRAAKKHGIKVGICGQAPSDYPEFAQFLVAEGIDSISVTSDAVLATMRKVVEQEQSMSGSPARTPA